MLDFLDNLNSTVLITGLLLAFSLLVWYREKVRPDTKKRLPPGPWGIPLLGILPFLGKYPERVFRKWSQTYGAVMAVPVGKEKWIVLNDFDSVYQALANQPTKMSGRPVNPFFEKLSLGYGILMVDYGDFWKFQRKFAMTTLHEFGIGGKVMEKRILEELSHLNDTIRAENEKAFNISIWLRSAVSNNILNVLMGRRFEYNDEKFQNVLWTLMNGFSSPDRVFVCGLFIFAPFLMNVPPFSFYDKAIMKDLRMMKGFIGDLISEHKEAFDPNSLRDFVDAFILEMRKGSSDTFTDMQLKNFVWELFLAGTETSSSTLDWALLCLLHYPKTQVKLRKEIEEVIGLSGSISMAHKSKMPYASAFIEEVMRYRTIVPLGVMHCTSEDTELNGYLISKGTTVLTNLWAVHNDPAAWHQPDKFIPERFLDTDGSFVKSSKVLPFSVGPRHCLGKQLAVMEVFILLIGMVQKFEFLPNPDSDTLPDIDSGSNGTVFATKAFQIVAKEL